MRKAGGSVATGSGAVISAKSLMGTRCGRRPNVPRRPWARGRTGAILAQTGPPTPISVLSPARACQVVVALHLHQARHGALELEGAVAVGVELLRRRGGGANEV